MGKLLWNSMASATATGLLLALACGSDDDGGSGFGAGAASGASGTAGALGTGADGNGIDLGGGGTAGKGKSGALEDGGLEDLREAACAGWQAEPEPLAVVLQLVVDNSGSMLRAAPGTTDSKWEVTREALREALSALPGSTSVGVLYYPNRATSSSRSARPASACVATDDLVPISALGAPTSAHRALIDDSLDAADPNENGGTPTHDAYNVALESLGASQAIGTRYMLLITDGQPTFSENCVGTGRVANPVDEAPIVAAIASARDAGIRTFVIGSPGSEENAATMADARPWLSRAAEAGDTQGAECAHAGPNFCHFDMTQEPDFGAALRAALAKIAGSIVSCDYELPAPPPGETLERGNVNVVHTAGSGTMALIPQSTTAECTEGWQYSPDQRRVVLCDATCQRVQADPEARLELLFGCATRTGPVE
jgi:hypothetical protein